MYVYMYVRMYTCARARALSTAVAAVCVIVGKHTPAVNRGSARNNLER